MREVMEIEELVQAHDHRLKALHPLHRHHRSLTLLAFEF